MRKKDWILIISLLAVALIVWSAMQLSAKKQQKQLKQQEQLQTLNEALDSALSSMKDKLDFMYNDFMEKGLDDTIEEDDLLK